MEPIFRISVVIFTSNVIICRMTMSPRSNSFRNYPFSASNVMLRSIEEKKPRKHLRAAEGWGTVRRGSELHMFLKIAYVRLRGGGCRNTLIQN